MRRQVDVTQTCNIQNKSYEEGGMGKIGTLVKRIRK
jgi:hypothetical protein